MPRNFYAFHKANQADFQRTLECVPWDLFINEDDIEETWDNFSLILNAVVKDIVPITKSKEKRRSPWITSEIVTLSRKKRRAYRKAVAKKGNVELWNKYKQLGEIVERCTIGHFQTLSTLNYCRIAPYAWIFDSWYHFKENRWGFQKIYTFVYFLSIFYQLGALESQK